MAVHVLSLNCQGLLSEWTQPSLAQKCLSRGVSVAFLQETHFTDETDVERLEDLTKGKVYQSVGSNHRAGTAILFLGSFLLCGSIISSAADPNGHWVMVEAEYSGTPFTLLSLHAPTYIADRRRLFQSLNSVLGDSPQNIIVSGDFNCVLDPLLDRRSTAAPGNDASVAALRGLLNSYGVTDCFRFLHPDVAEYKWTSPTGIYSSRLDRIYCSKGLKGHLTFAGHAPIPISDHTMALAKFDSGHWVEKG